MEDESRVASEMRHLQSVARSVGKMSAHNWQAADNMSYGYGDNSFIQAKKDQNNQNDQAYEQNVIRFKNRENESSVENEKPPAEIVSFDMWADEKFGLNIDTFTQIIGDPFERQGKGERDIVSVKVI